MGGNAGLGFAAGGGGLAGNGGDGSGSPFFAAGGGGGLGGNGGSATMSGSGGGGGLNSQIIGSSTTLLGAPLSSGGVSALPGAPGGISGGGGGGGQPGASGNSSGNGGGSVGAFSGGGGGSAGAIAISSTGGSGGFGGGGGGGGSAGSGGFGGGGGGGAGGGGSTGGDGGFGGGGGGSAFSGGDGGFGGGGGGAAVNGGAGGFGGGGGGVPVPQPGRIPGPGGFGAGSGSYDGTGGGGAAFGGSVFVNSGGVLTIRDNSSVAGGSVVGGVGGGFGAGNGVARGEGIFLNGAAVTFDIGASQIATIQDAIADDNGAGLTAPAGPGQLNKTGAGILRLTAVNSYSGGTRVTAGTLAVNADSALGRAGTGLLLDGATLRADAALTSNRAITLNSGGGTIDNNGNAVTLSGVLSGTGGLTKDGAGTLILSGVNGYAGATVIANGILAATGGNAIPNSSAVVMQAGSTLQVVQSQTVGSIEGTGSAAIVVGQNLTAGGNNASTVYSGTMSGGGGLVKAGSGDLHLSGNNTYTGDTTVNGGRLFVNGSVSGSVLTNAGATLAGSGRISGSVSIAPGGVYSPGNSIGTQSVMGNVEFRAGSTFVVEADPAGNADRVAASGVVTVAGGNVSVVAASGIYKLRSHYRILSSDAGVSGTFSGVSSNLAFLSPSLSYDALNVYLTLTRNGVSFVSAARSPNDIGVARALENASVSASGDMETVVNALLSGSREDAGAALQRLGGALFGNIAALRQGLVASRNRAIVSRLALASGSVETGAGTGLAFDGLKLAFQTAVLPELRSDASPQLRPDAVSNSRHFWVRALAGTTVLEGDAFAPGSKTRQSGLIAGLDARLSPNWLIGAALAYATPDVTEEVSGSSIRQRSAYANVYGRFTVGNWHADGVAGFGSDRTSAGRNIQIVGLARSAQADFSGTTANAYIEGGYTFRIGEALAQPLLAVGYIRSKTKGFTESGAGAANLVVSPSTETSLKSTVGARFARRFSTGRTNWIGEFRVARVHEFRDPVATRAQFSGDATGTVFQSAGSTVPKSSAVWGFGFSGQATNNLSFYVDYNAEKSDRVNAKFISAGLRSVW